MVGLTLAAAMGSSQAALVFLSVVPGAWRLQTYVGATGGGNVTLWFTGSPCSNGNITMVNPSEGDKNRLWSTVLAAKLASRRMFVYYDDAGAPGTCAMNSFGMDDQ